MNSTKKEVLNFCIEKAINSSDLKSHTISSNFISRHLNISRSLSSQYLNDLFREGELLKIASRPTLFIHKKTLENQYQFEIEDNLFYSLEDIEEKLKDTINSDGYHQMIGYDRSLSRVIDQFMAAIKYPNGGLPIFIKGEVGVGKALLCKEMFKHAKNNNLLSSTAKYKKMEITDSNDNYYNDICRAIKMCGDGILYICQPHKLSYECQQQLCNIIEKKLYVYNNIEENLETHIVISENSFNEMKLNSGLLHCFPVVIDIPSYIMREKIEREEIIISLFRKQAITLRTQMFVGRNIISIMVNFNFKDNIAELKNLIYEISANAYNHNKSNAIYITLSNLPSKYIHTDYLNDINKMDESKINVNLYKRQDASNLYIKSLSKIIEEIRNNSMINSNQATVTDLESIIKIIQRVYDDNQVQKYSEVDTIIKLCLDKTLKSYNLTIPLSCSQFLNNYLYYKYINNEKIEKFDENNDSGVGELYKILSKNDASFTLAIEKLVFELEHNFSFKIGNIYRLITYIVISFFNISRRKSKYLCIIITHGISTASSIAAAANELLESNIFHGLDMPLKTTTEDMVRKLKDYINQYMVKSDVLLLVDMGSLEMLGEYLKSMPNRHIGIINNVSTRTALIVGEKVLDNKEISQVLDYASKEIKTSYTLIENKIVDEVVIFISENGITMAEKMRDIFVNSFPKSSELEVIAMELNNYMDEEYIKLFQEEHDILFVSGTCEKCNNKFIFIPIEDLIEEENLNLVTEKLSKVFNPKELEVLNKRILYNFSLNNIIDSITILDAKRLMNLVEKAVDNLQLMLGIELLGSTIVGLYMHLCCMVERLVTRDSIKTNSNLETFVVEKKGFIKAVKLCFEPICKHYGIIISESEISYLYDYINADKNKKVYKL